jgi:hypothetical protein
MQHRCYNPRCRAFKNYGGRGITICKEWLNFSTFRNWAWSHGYDDTLTIERVDNDGNYEPGNCEWISKTRQGRNRRTSRMITAFGQTKCAADWAEDPRCVVRKDSFYWRIRRGWDAEKALSTPRHNTFPGPRC